MHVTLTQLLLIFALGASVSLFYIRGNRKNRSIISFISKELESALNPSEKLYKNLGGTIGYKAFYKRPGNINEVVALFTTLPRHSIFLYPIHLLLKDHDRLQINGYSQKAIKYHFIAIKNGRRYRKLIDRYNNQGEMNKQNITIKDREFTIYYRDNFSRDACINTLNDMDISSLISFAAVPDNNAIHITCIPYRGKIYPLIRNIFKESKKFMETKIDSRVSDEHEKLS